MLESDLSMHEGDEPYSKSTPTTRNASPTRKTLRKKPLSTKRKRSAEDCDPANLLAILSRIKTRRDAALERWELEESQKKFAQLNSFAKDRLGFALETGPTHLSAYFKWQRFLEGKQRKTFYQGPHYLGKCRKRARWTQKLEPISSSSLPLNEPEEERNRLWRLIARKEIPKVARILVQSSQARLSNARRIAGLCARETRKLASRTSRLTSKDAATRARKALREMLSFWKRNEREERELRKRAEKEAAERRRLEEEERENRRQAKKLNFLLTQTELYSHFIAKKGPQQPAVSAQGSKLAAGIDFADVEDQVLRDEAERVALEAVAAQRDKTRLFDDSVAAARASSDAPVDFSTVPESAFSTIRQPAMLECRLKDYQLKGLGWLANLYEQGINGILADEMGLGKTVQAISLLAHLAETHNIWGPFLVIAPASTLHNWQQEIRRFVPAFKVLPYWGNVNDRATLRKFWNPKKLYGRDANFHVLITSYQLIVSDEKYFQRIKWQYMVLDEAQAIKSSGSIRWKTLLSFHCRNRLLLTGTPIQNSMQELWALLHFIMPSLFDSHDEFSEWFSRDIESHAEQKSALDAHQVQRLHLILRPFMLRREKRDVEDELGRKIEINLYCDLSPKQRALYQSISEGAAPNMRELLAKLDAAADPQMLVDDADSTLMNLVMQFRKVCNHPELFGRSQVESPLFLGHTSTFVSSANLPAEGLYNWFGPGDGWLNTVNDKVPLVDNHSLILPIVDSPPEILCSTNNFIIEDLVPVSVRFLSDRLPMAYQPKAISRSPLPPITPIRSIGWDYSIGKRTILPSMEKFLADSGKLCRLDQLLVELKAGGHRVLIYNQMTRMIDLMEEFLAWRGYTYIRLDGSSKISDRRDLVQDWQSRSDLFIFLLSTRAGGLGINLTAADTVIFYDCDWNPTVDQQAMDRAHRLGQTKQVTVYRLISRGTIEERVILRARQKDEIHRVVIAGV